METSEYTGYKYIHYGDIHTKVANVIDESSTLPNIRAGNYDLLDNGDLVLADASEDYQGIAMPAVVTISPPYKLVAGLHTIALRPTSADPLFLYYLIRSPIFRKYGYKIGTGMKVFGISATNVLKFESKFPSVHEQEKIGKLLKKMDDAIALHQRKLNLLKQLKQTYLQQLFPQNEENIPALRFAGFSEPWEQRKLIEEVDFFDEKRIPIDSEKRSQGGYPYYGATGVIDYVDNYIFDGEYILLAEDGANIITRNSPIAYITEGKFWLNNHAHIMRMKFGSNLFLLQLLEKQTYEKYNSGTAQPKLNGQIVKNMIFNFPSYEEQIKIGSSFKQLDDAITLHQQKTDNMQGLKNVLLNRMLN